MHQEPVGLGLRESARKYGVDAQTIRYWIKRGWVTILQEPDGPGKSMMLNEASLVEALKRYTPHRDRVGRPLPAEVMVSRAAEGRAPPPAREGGFGWHDWRRLTVSMTMGAIVLALLLVPMVAMAAATVTLAPTATEYVVGEKIDFTGTIAFNSHPENLNIDRGGVTFAVSGNQALSVTLPDSKATFTQDDISGYPTYSSDPDGSGPLAAGDPIGTLSGSVTLTNWSFTNFTGYGYGYGYGYTTGATSNIVYDLDYTPPVLLSPAPSALASPYTAPDKLYDAPGGGGGGGGGPIVVTEMFQVPGIPGAPFGSNVIDIDYDSSYNEILVLVDGPGKDVVGYLNPSGYVQYNQDAAMMPNEAAAISVVQGQVFVVVKAIQMSNSNPPTPVTTWKIEGLGGNPQQNIETGGGNTPSNDIKSLMFDQNAGAFFAAEEQTSPNAQITIWKMDYDDNTGFGPMTTFQVAAMPTNGGYTGLTALNSGSYLGGYGGQAVQFDPTTQSTLGQHPITGPNGDVGFIVSGLTINTSTNELILMNEDDNHLYSADIPTAGVAASTQPVGIAYRVSSGFNTSYILVDCGPSCGYDYIAEVKHTNTAGNVLFVSGGFAIPALQNQTGFYAINDQVEGLAYIHPNLYIVENTGSGNPNKKRLYKLNVTDATAVAATRTGGGWQLVGALSQSVGDIGGMTVKGGKLYLAETNDDIIHKVNVDGTYEGSFSLLATGNMNTPMGLNGLAFISAANNYAGTGTFIGVSGNAFYQFKPNAGADQGTITAVNYTNPGSPPFNSMGLSSKQSNVLALDGDTGGVYQGSLPGQPDPETTTAGDYTAVLTVASSTPTATTASTASAYTVSKVSTLTITITEPLPNQGYKMADLTGGKVEIIGTLNDPTVVNVGVLADLPSAVLLGYDPGDGKEASTFTASADKAQYSTNGLWHFTTTADAAIHNPFGPEIQSHNFLTGTYAYYGANETASPSTSKPNFCQTQPGMPIPPNATKCMVPEFMQAASSGYFDSPAITVSAGGDATLTFDVWWEVETAADWDNLQLQSCTGTPGSAGASCTLMAQLAATQDLPPVYSAGQVIPCAGIGYPACPSAQKLIAVPNALSGGAMTSVSFPLPSGLSGTVFFRWKFDSVDPYANHFTGVLLDNIAVTGAGSIILASATVNKTTNPPSWSLLMTPEEGTNAITISAVHDAYVTGGLTANANATFFLDTQAPTLTITALSEVTSDSTLTISGTFLEAQPQLIDIYNTVGAGSALSVGKITSFAEGVSTFSKSITLSEGSNKIEVRIKDKAGQCNTSDTADCTTTILDTDTIVLDTAPPVITAGETAYPTGYVSARQGDLVVLQTNCTDAAGKGIRSVKAASPKTPTVFDKGFRTEIPGAVKDQWLSGINGGSAAALTYLLPITIADTVAPGTLTLNVKCVDTAGNEVTSTVSVTIVSTLAGFVLNLMPGDNLVSLPIIPDIADSSTLEASLDTLVAGVVSPVDGLQAIDRILYYDATNTGASAANRWKIWTADPNDTNSLTTMKTGRGYIVQMRAAAFKASASIAAGVPATQAPISLRYEGTFLKGGMSTPPVYSVEGTGGAWNLIGLHSEDSEIVSNYFQPLESPSRIWGSALVYSNVIIFPITKGETPTVTLGAFMGLVSTDYIDPGSGIWLFALADGSLVPR